MKSPVEFIGTCVHLDPDKLEEYDDSEKEIKYSTFLKYVGRDVVKYINEWSGVHIKKDWAVSFGKGVYGGRKVVCMHHSSIHHIYAI